MLLTALDSWRVFQAPGNNSVNVAAYDIRAHLTRIFGFGRWSGEVIAMEPVFDLPWAVGKDSPAPGAYVAYRCGYRLTIRAMDGTVLATFTEWAVGDSKKTLVNHADAHDMAIKTAESQALKRCAINLGDQFGLSLYHKPTVAIAKTNLQNPNRYQPIPRLLGGTLLQPGQNITALEMPKLEMGEEVDPDHVEDVPTRDVNTEPVAPVSAPVSDPTPETAPPPTPQPDSAQQPAPSPAEDPKPDIPADVQEAINGLQEAISWLPNQNKAALRKLWDEKNAPPLRDFANHDQVNAAWELYAQVKPAPAQQPTEDAAAQQVRQQQQAAARRHFPADVPADNYQPEPDYNGM